jgi:hypothetical protein
MRHVTCLAKMHMLYCYVGFVITLKELSSKQQYTLQGMCSTN